MAICELVDGDASASQLKIDSTSILSKKILQYILIVSVVLAIIFFFCVRRKQKKPLFVKAIFALLVVVCLLDIVQDGLEAYENNNNLSLPKLSTSINIIISIKSTLGSVCHWIFAEKYFELALYLPMYLGFVDSKVITKH